MEVFMEHHLDYAWISSLRLRFPAGLATNAPSASLSPLPGWHTALSSRHLPCPVFPLPPHGGHAPSYPKEFWQLGEDERILPRHVQSLPPFMFIPKKLLTISPQVS